ncbi:SseB family protein [Allokutzneria oryzae]|uniref:SseB family protein n=1 Tax=Allokutzneria oryzae TaxID=1378989 RepID=A0ABV6A5T8_9PSEU
MESGWAPANQVEQNMAAALEEGDGKRYANTVMSAPLFLPVLPERGSERWRELNTQLPLDQPHVLVFTSTEAMELLLGSYTRGHIQTDYPSLAKRWPSPDFHLALNPGLPIGSVMPFGALEQLRTGQESLVSAEAVAESVQEEIRKQVRVACLTGLGLAATAAPRPGPPANELEVNLAAAMADADGEAFLTSVLEAELVVPTSAPVADPEAIHEPGFPWLELGPAIPAFTSQEMLDRTVADAPEHLVTVPFLALLANWPDPDHALCLNPGADTELILTGETLFTMLIEMADDLPQQDGTPDLPPVHGAPMDDHTPPPVDDHITITPPFD